MLTLRKYFTLSIVASVFGLVLGFGSIASAELVSPVGIALLDLNGFHAEFPGSESSVCGVRLTILRSVNKEVCGVDLGLLVSGTAGNFTGVGLSGVANIVAGRARIVGLQAAGLINLDGQASILGLQLALVNRVLNDGTVVGGQLAIWNGAPKTDIYGFQLSAFNQAHKVVGFQIGLLNVTDELHGIQIGLFNINRNGIIKAFPGLNASF